MLRYSRTSRAEVAGVEGLVALEAVVAGEALHVEDRVETDGVRVRFESAAENDDAAADGNFTLVCGLAQAGDKVDGVIDAGQVFALDPQCVDA